MQFLWLVRDSPHLKWDGSPSFIKAPTAPQHGGAPEPSKEALSHNCVGFGVQGHLAASDLQGAVLFNNALWKWRENECCMRACVPSCFTCVWLFATPWIVACQVPLSMGFSRQGYWSGLPFPSPGDLPDPGMEPESLKVSCTGRQVLYR